MHDNESKDEIKPKRKTQKEKYSHDCYHTDSDCDEWKYPDWEKKEWKSEKRPSEPAKKMKELSDENKENSEKYNKGIMDYINDSM